MAAMRTVRTSVDADVFTLLEAQALRRGITVAALAREYLSTTVNKHENRRNEAVARRVEVRAEVRIEVSSDEWAAFRTWVGANPRVLSTYTGSRKWSEAGARANVIGWAVTEHGYLHP